MTGARPRGSDAVVDRDDLAYRVKDRALVSCMLLVGGVAAALIPFAGTILVLFVGWIPLLMWMVGGIDLYFETVREHRTGLRGLAAFSMVAPLGIYALHLWIVTSGR